MFCLLKTIYFLLYFSLSLFQHIYLEVSVNSGTNVIQGPCTGSLISHKRCIFTVMCFRPEHSCGNLYTDEYQ